VVSIDVGCSWEERSVLVDSFWGCGMNGWSLAIGVGDVECSSARSQWRLRRRRNGNVLAVIAPVFKVCLAAYYASAVRSCYVCLLQVCSSSKMFRDAPGALLRYYQPRNESRLCIEVTVLVTAQCCLRTRRDNSEGQLDKSCVVLKGTCTSRCPDWKMS
jgi:hypothetical protein